MRKIYRRPQAQDNSKKFKINSQIMADFVRLIGPNGEYFGEVNIEEARAKSVELGFDLIEIGPTAKPPICKIMDYGKFQYDQEKQLKKAKAKQKQVEVKGIRLSLRIGQHDSEVRVNQAKKFLQGGDKVKIELILRGRERQHVDSARQIIGQFVEEVKKDKELQVVVLEPLSMQGGRMGTVIGRK